MEGFRYHKKRVEALTKLGKMLTVVYLPKADWEAENALWGLL